MNTHPYIPFKVVPNPVFGVSLPIDFDNLEKALNATLQKVSQRNKDLIPQDLYERANRVQKAA